MARISRGSDEPMPYGPPSRPPELEGAQPTVESVPSTGVTPTGGPPPPPPPPTAPGSPDLAPPPPPPAPVLAPPPMVAWAPVTQTSPPGPGPGLRYGSVFARFVAWFADSLLLGIAAIAVQVVLGVYGSRTVLADVLAAVIGTGFSILYFVGFWTGPWRATPAMRVLGLQVSNSLDGVQATVRQGLARWAVLEGISALIGLTVNLVPISAATSVGLLIDGWVLVLLLSTFASRTKQGIHDRVARTVVSQPEGASWGPPCAVLVVIALVMVVLGFALIALLGPQIQKILSDVGTSI